jgi:AcrR family transcriptional regulator
VIGDPQNARSARTRAAILDAAWRLLEEHGPEGASMTAVARQAGVTRRGLYLHFPSRTELLAAVRRHVDEVLGLEDSVRPIREAPDAVAALREWVRHLTDYHSRLRAVVDATDRARATDADAAAVWEETMEIWRAGCVAMAERLAAEGVLAPGWTVPAAADALWGLMVGFNRMWQALVVERGWSRDRFFDFLARMHDATFLHVPAQG